MCTNRTMQRPKSFFDFKRLGLVTCVFRAAQRRSIRRVDEPLQQAMIVIDFAGEDDQLSTWSLCVNSALRSPSRIGMIFPAWKKHHRKGDSWLSRDQTRFRSPSSIRDV